MNDSLIIVCVLALVFGALFYYLHSRLAYTEKRVNVMETILLDIKNASDQLFSAAGGTTATTTTAFDSLPEPYSVSAAEPYSPQPEQQQPEQQQQQQQEEEIQVATQRNYTSMTKPDLVKEAQSRNIPGAASMKRSKLIEALQQNDTNITTDELSSHLTSELIDSAEELATQ